MHSHPTSKRRGIGRLIIGLCKGTHRKEVFFQAERSALANKTLFWTAGQAIKELIEDRGRASTPLLHIAKDFRVPIVDFRFLIGKLAQRARRA